MTRINTRILIRNIVIAGTAGGTIATIEIPPEYIWIRSAIVATAACVLGAMVPLTNDHKQKIDVPPP
jgi:hypothetical protein